MKLVTKNSVKFWSAEGVMDHLLAQGATRIVSLGLTLLEDCMGFLLINVEYLGAKGSTSSRSYLMSVPEGAKLFDAEDFARRVENYGVRLN